MKTIVHTLKATHKDKTILGYQRYELVPVPLMRGETIDGKEYWSAFYFCDGQLTTDNGDIGMEASPDPTDHDACYLTTWEESRWLNSSDEGTGPWANASQHRTP